MGNIAKKSTIIEEIALSKMQEEILAGQLSFRRKKKTASMDSTKTKGKNLISFMLDLVEALMGKISKVKKKVAEGKKKRKKKIATIKSSMPPIVLTLLTTVLARLLPTIQQKVIDVLMKYLSDNCALDTPNLPLPSGFINGMTISSTNLDTFRILKEDFNSKTGKIFFGNANTFPAVLRTTALNPGIANAITYSLIPGTSEGLNVWYDDINDKFNIKPTANFKDINLKDFFKSMLKKTIPFTAQSFITLACDQIFGTLSKKIDTTIASIPPVEVQSRTMDDITNDEYISTIIENYLEYDLDDVVETDTFFTFSDEQKGLIESKINSRFNAHGSFIADCGEVNASIPSNFLFDTLDVFTGATKSSETKIVGQVLNTIGDVATANLTDENKDSGKKGFFRQLVKLFPVITTKMFLTPDVVLLMEISKLIKNQNTLGPQASFNAPQIKSGKEFLQKNPQIIREISKEFYGEIMKELYIIVKEEITKLVIIKVKAIVAEKAKNYLAIIVSGLNAQANKALQKVKPL